MILEEEALMYILQSVRSQLFEYAF